MIKKIKEIENQFQKDLGLASSEELVESLRLNYLGKKGKVSEVLGLLRDVPAQDKREFGMAVNRLKTAIELEIEGLKSEIERKKVEAEIKKGEKYDITLPISTNTGSLHPRTIIQKEIEDVFVSMGFTVERGSEVVTEYENFDSVNVPESHPARDMQDTFWLSTGELLRTQTSAMQNEILKKYNGPFKAIFPGRVFRNEAMDASHENTFFQIEGMVVGENISVANLIYFMKEMLEKVFKKEIKVRLRPGFFPFTEPSFELDIFCPFCDGKGCSVCKNGQWIELCPCGMIHPNVFKEAGYDTEKYNGFAFGLGFDRLAMIRGEINDIRYLNSGNLRFLKQLGLNM